ncbi:MAG: dehydrogenase [Acetobacteraceae bacterium]|nr:dehydrogenase [Acetobacteraceae bacterium]
MTERPVIVRARAPLRLGLAGGGTDLSPYCDTHGGAILNSTIARYAHVSIAPSPDGRVHFRARDIDHEESFECDEARVATGRLAIHGGVWRRMVAQFRGGTPGAWTITTHVDAPPGSGLGSSSALAVALVEAFRTLLALPLGLYDVAHLAYEIERIDLGLAGGRQDQYAAAFGGTNFMEFLSQGRVIVNPLRVSRPHMNELESALVTCFTGVSRSSEQIIEEQQRGMADAGGPALDSLHQLKQDAIDMKQALLHGEIAALAAILNRSWIAKQRTAAGVSTARIDELFRVAMANGATAGKVSGAGGGGFIMFLAPPEAQVRLIRALTAAGGVASPVHFTSEGAESWITPG